MLSTSQGFYSQQFFSIIFVIITEVHERIEILKKKYVQVQYDIYVYKINDVQEY